MPVGTTGYSYSCTVSKNETKSSHSTVHFDTALTGFAMSILSNDRIVPVSNPLSLDNTDICIHKIFNE